MRPLAATLLLTLTGAVVAADDVPPIKAGLPRGGEKKATAPAPRPADDKKDDKKADDKKAPARKELSREERLKAAQNGYQSYCAMWVDALRRAENEKQKESLLKNLPNPGLYAGQAARLVLDNPKDEVAFDALQWLVRYKDVPQAKKVLAAVPGKKGEKPGKLDVFAALLEHHVENPKLGTLVRGLWEHTPEHEAFLEAVYEKATKPAVRGYAGVQLAEMLNRKSEEPDMPASLRGKFLKEAEAIYAKLIADEAVMKLVLYKDQDGKEHTLGDRLPGDLRAVRELSVGKALPGIVGRDLDGNSVRLSEAYKGKVVVLDVWATWCGPCRAMIPHEREMVGRLKDKPFALISVSADEEKDTLTDFLKKEPMPWAHWWDGKDGPLNKELNIRFYPTIYVIDAKGVIRYKNIREEKLEEAVNKLLKEIDGDKSAGGGR